MLAGLRFGVPGLPCLSPELWGAGTAGVDGIGVLLVKVSKETSVPSAFLTVTLAAVRGTNVREPASSRLATEIEGVDGVGGGDVKPRLFECARVGGWGT